MHRLRCKYRFSVRDRGKLGVRPMSTHTSSLASAACSVVMGEPLSAESGLGSMTIPGYLREVTARFGSREALVLHTKDEVARWSYQTLWDRSAHLARALLAAGVGKDSRVGVLMSNRPEFVAAVFG